MGTWESILSYFERALHSGIGGLSGQVEGVTISVHGLTPELIRVFRNIQVVNGNPALNTHSMGCGFKHSKPLPSATTVEYIVHQAASVPA